VIFHARAKPAATRTRPRACSSHSACVTSAGADHVGREHIIEHPHKIIVDGSSPSTVGRIDIQGADGARTQITLHGDPHC